MFEYSHSLYGNGMGDGEKPTDSTARLAIAMTGLSFSAVLFTLSLFKLLSFFVMPSLFFDLLFIGFPIGAYWAARETMEDVDSVRRGLVKVRLAIVFSVVCSLFAKRIDYLRAHLFDVSLIHLMRQIALFSAMFLPFFVVYGMAEYTCYRVGRKRFGGKVRGVYALALFGAATAYPFFQSLLPTLGMARMILTSTAALAVSNLALADHRGSRRVKLEIALLAAISLIPGLESRFLDLYKGSGAQSTREFKNQGYHQSFQKWGRHSLCEILGSHDQKNYYGFYNDLFQWEYSPKFGFEKPALGTAPISLYGSKSRLAIVGAGGGRQVRFALRRTNPREIVAIELEPAIFDAVRNPEHLLKQFGRVYEHRLVVPVAGEARGYFEKHHDRFDLIYLPSVGGYPQMMIEPGNMIRTLEAYRLMRDRLTEHGVLAVWYPAGLDRDGILTRQYVRTLRLLGMPTGCYRNAHEYLVLAFRDRSTIPPDPSKISRQYLIERWKNSDPEWYRSIIAQTFVVDEDPKFRPITDDRPFLAGNISYILSINQVNILYASAAVTLVAAIASIWFWQCRGRKSPVAGRSIGSTALLGFLIGANFLMIEHALVLDLFRRHYVYDDSLAWGAVVFLMFSGIGSLIESKFSLSAITIAALIATLITLTMPDRLSPVAVVLLYAPVAAVTGSFFPALFDRASKNPLSVFAFDALGAATGAMLSSYIPIVLGFRVGGAISAAVFAITIVANRRFHRGLDAETEPESESAA